MLRFGNYNYKRRVPAALANQYIRSPIIQIALNTDDIVIARIKRDMLEKADNEYWAALMLGAHSDNAMENYQIARRQAEAFGLLYKTADQLAKSSMQELVSRFTIL